MSETIKRDKALILVVDDNPANITLISSHISLQGYDLAIATNGPKAIEITNAYKPDLILLDIMMPVMDGYEVCRRLKADVETEKIPIIFLSAANSQEDIIKGFGLGAVDYITKPFNSAELQARLRTHLKLKNALEEIENDKVVLERLNIEKNEFLGIAAHDLKNPIYNISMLAKLVRDDKTMSREEIDEFTQDIVASTDKMLHIITDLLDINAIENGKIVAHFEDTNMQELLLEIFNSFKDRALAKNIDLKFNRPDHVLYAQTDRSALIHIMDNLVSNALKFTDSGKKVEIVLEDSNTDVIVGVKDTGPGFTLEDKQRMFKRFQRLSAQPTAGEHSTGLGLSIVKRYVELIDSKIELDEDYVDGAYFKLIIPKIHFDK